MYRENPIRKWLGPFIVRDQIEKILILGIGDRLLWESVYKVNPYLEKAYDIYYGKLEVIAPLFQSDERGYTHKNDVLFETKLKYNNINLDLQVATPKDLPSGPEESEILDCIREAEKLHSIESGKDGGYTWETEGLQVEVNFTEVLKPGDVRFESADFIRAKVLESKVLRSRNGWK